MLARTQESLCDSRLGSKKIALGLSEMEVQARCHTLIHPCRTGETLRFSRLDNYIEYDDICGQELSRDRMTAKALEMTCHSVVDGKNALTKLYAHQTPVYLIPRYI